MKLPVVFLPAADAELESAFGFYDEQVAGLGARFVARVEATLGRFTDNPLAYPVVKRQVRKAVVQRFPFCIFYRVFDDRIEVVAVFHTSRNPRVWMRRV